MNRTVNKIYYEPREREKEPLQREIMVHLSMFYQCDCCRKIFRFWLEKGLEDKRQDLKEPERHKPVPYCTACLCGGTLQHSFWNMDVQLDDYRRLKENENYFENEPESSCGIPHIRNEGHAVIREESFSSLPELRDLSAVLEADGRERQRRQKRNEMFLPPADEDDFEDDPYGLAHISTTTLKKELRRRKGGWKK